MDAMDVIEFAKLFDDLETVDIDHVHVFSAGTWEAANGVRYTYTRKDMYLAASETNDMLLKKDGSVPLTPGHEIFRRMGDNTPALGWFQNFTEQAGELYADLKQVPKKIAQLIKAGTYKFRSAGFKFNYSASNGAKYPLIVTHVSLLGAIPASLQHLDSMFTREEINADENSLVFSLPVEEVERKKTKEVSTMTPEEMAAQKVQMEENARLKADLDNERKKTAEFSRQDEEKKKLEADLKAANEKNAEFSRQATESRNKARTEYVDGLKTRIPNKADRDVIEHALAAIGDTAEYSRADNSKANVLEDLKGIFSRMPEVRERKAEYSRTGEKRDGGRNEEKKQMSQFDYSRIVSSTALGMGFDPNALTMDHSAAVGKKIKEEYGDIQITN